MKTTRHLILALDFDGVLHEETFGSKEIDEPFVHVPLFEEWVDKADPDGLVGILISSNWRKHENLSELQSHFSPGFAERIIGATPVLRVPDLGLAGLLTKGHRQAEIETALKVMSPTLGWIALDNEPEGFRNDCENLILLPDDGLDEYSARDLFWAIRNRLDTLDVTPQSKSYRP